MQTNTFGMYFSALKDEYRQKNLNFEMCHPTFYQKTFQGYRNEIAMKRGNGVMKVREGKLNFTVDGYTQICRTLMNLAPKKNKNNKGVKFGFLEGLKLIFNKVLTK